MKPNLSLQALLTDLTVAFEFLFGPFFSFFHLSFLASLLGSQLIRQCWAKYLTFFKVTKPVITHKKNLQLKQKTGVNISILCVIMATTTTRYYYTLCMILITTLPVQYKSSTENTFYMGRQSMCALCVLQIPRDKRHYAVFLTMGRWPDRKSCGEGRGVEGGVGCGRYAGIWQTKKEKNESKV